MQVKFEAVEKKYGNTFAVQHLDLTIPSGALHFLLGPSGCGKTTTLRMLAGLEPVTRGKILFDDRDVTDLPAAERGIGMVFQNYALWPHMTVRKNIEYGLKVRKLASAAVRQRVDEVLEFTQLTRFVDRLPGQLSGGQQQRVALARALAIRPNVLLLDEPLSNLDAKLRLEMRDNITRIHKQTGITTVYVTHDQKEALSMGTHISVMYSGRLMQTAAPRSMYQAPTSPFVAGFIGEANLLDATFVKQDGAKGVGIFKTSAGELRASCGALDNLTPGKNCVVMFRPESVKLIIGDQVVPAGANKIPATLEHLTYLGESEQFQLRLDGQSLVKASIVHGPKHDLRDGARVHIAVSTEDVLALDLDKNMGLGT
jgi:ABC-type Fe3+/spermidine/putrescine transport system ATPase subunit